MIEFTNKILGDKQTVTIPKQASTMPDKIQTSVVTSSAEKITLMTITVGACFFLMNIEIFNMNPYLRPLTV